MVTKSVISYSRDNYGHICSRQHLYFFNHTNMLIEARSISEDNRLNYLMLSPDNYIQTPDFSQSFNRYSYCLNNPINLVDKSGFYWLDYDYDYDYEDPPDPTYWGGWKTGIEVIASFDDNYTTREIDYDWNDFYEDYLYEYASGGGGPGWEAYAGAAASVISELYYSKTFGTWMGKDFKIRQQTWSGNGRTGGKKKFGKTTSNGFKWAGRLAGAYSGYKTIEQRINGKIGTGWMLAELVTTGFSTFGGLEGAAWGIGWETGRFITSMEWYQEAKFNFWYNHWESQVGAPSQYNEDLWFYFYQNYKP